MCFLYNHTPSFTIIHHHSQSFIIIHSPAGVTRGVSGSRSRADRRRAIGALPHGVGAGGGVGVADADAGAGFAIAVATDAGIGGAFVNLQFNGVTAAAQRIIVQVRQHTDVHGTFDHVGIGLGAVHGVTATGTTGGSRTIVVPGKEGKREKGKRKREEKKGREKRKNKKKTKQQGQFKHRFSSQHPDTTTYPNSPQICNTSRLSFASLTSSAFQTRPMESAPGLTIS